MRKDMDNKQQTTDDGSLGFLRLPQPETNKQFHCEKTTQMDLANKTFWVLDYEPNVKTKFGDDRYLVFIKFELEDDQDKARKFFTNSPDIKRVLDLVRERNAFPRRVTMRTARQQYWLE